MDQHTWKRAAGGSGVMHLLPKGAERALCGVSCPLWVAPTNGQEACSACIDLITTPGALHRANEGLRSGPTAPESASEGTPALGECPICHRTLQAEPSTVDPTRQVVYCAGHGWQHLPQPGLSAPIEPENGSESQPAGAPAAPLRYRGDDEKNDDPDNDFATFGDVLPPGVVPLRGIKIVQYLDGDGEPAYEWRLWGDHSLIELLGLLEFVQLRAFRSSELGNCDG